MTDFDALAAEFGTPIAAPGQPPTPPRAAASAPQSVDFDALATEFGTRPSDNLGAALIASRGTDPATAAQRRKNALALGVQESLLTGSKTEVDDIAYQKYTAENLVKDSPKTADFLALGTNAEIVGKDIAGLAGLELAFGAPTKRVLKGLAVGFAERIKQAGQGLRLADAFSRLEDADPGAFVQGPRGAPAVLDPNIPTLNPGYVPDLNVTTSIDADVKATKALAAPALADIVSTRADFAASEKRITAARPKLEGNLERGVYGGVESSLAMLPPLAVGLALRNPYPGLAYFGVTTGLPAAAKYGDRALTNGGTVEQARDAAFIGGLVEGGSEIGGEFLGFTFLTKYLGNLSPGKFVTGLLTRDIPGELVTTTIQTAADTAIANPNKTWEQWRAELPDALKETAVAVVTQSLLFGSGNVLVRRGAEGQAKIDTSTAALGQVKALAEASRDNPVLARSPEAFHDFVTQIAQDGVSEVFVDGKTLRDVFAQAGVTPEEIQRKLPEVAAQLDDAVAATHDVRISTADLLTYVTNPTAQEALLPHIKDAPNGLTFAQLETALPELKAENEQRIERLLVEDAKEEALQADIATVRDSLVADLGATGRFTERVTQDQAQPIVDFITTTAREQGRTPSEFYQEFKLNIQGARLTGAPLKQTAQEALKLPRGDARLSFDAVEGTDPRAPFHHHASALR